MRPAQVNARRSEKSVGDFPPAPWWLFRMGGAVPAADDPSVMLIRQSVPFELATVATTSVPSALAESDV